MDTASSTKKVDVTVLGDEERQYANPPLKDGAAGSATGKCTASGLLDGSEPEVTDLGTTTGWICEEAEVTYEVGKHVTWSASWSYYPAEE